MPGTEELVNELQQAWNQFREQNERDTGEAREAAERANNAISEIQNQIEQERQAREEQASRLEEAEDTLQRVRRTGGSQSPQDAATLRAYAQWQTNVQGEVVTPQNVDYDLISRYNQAFSDVLRRGTNADHEHLRLVNEMSVGSDPDGGYWVSPDMTGRIVQRIFESSPIRQLATVTTGSDAELEGDLDLDEAGAGWVGETESRPETDTPKIGKWRIRADEMYAMPEATQRVLSDANRDIEGWLIDKDARRFSRLEADGFVNGNGNNKPRGFLTYPAGTPDADDWEKIEQVNIGATASTIGDASADLLIDLVYSLKADLRDDSVFGGTRLTEAEIRKIKDGDGNYLWQPDFSRLGRATLLGFPFVEMADMPEIAANSLSVVYGNFGEAYQIYEHAGMRMLRDPYTKKGYVRFYTTRRVGGGVVNTEALKIGKVAT